jgi:hypothetical protein
MPTPTGLGREGAIAPRSSHNPTLRGFSRAGFYCHSTKRKKRYGSSRRRFGLPPLRRGTTTPSLASAQRAAGDPLPTRGRDSGDSKCSASLLNPRPKGRCEAGRSLPLSQIRMR